MAATEFIRRKMQWLNGVNADHTVNATSFRVAYAIADHLSEKWGFAWPGHARMADRLGLSTKSISRAVVQLENRGWLQIRHRRNRTNEYRIVFPTHELSSLILNGDQDKNVLSQEQIRPVRKVTDVSETYSTKLPRTFLSGLGEGQARRSARDRGTFERRLAARLGFEGWAFLHHLESYNPKMLDRLCELERDNNLSDQQLDYAKSIAMSRRAEPAAT